MKRALVLLVPTALLLGCGTDVAGPTTALLSCAFGVPSTLAPGEVLQTSGPANTACLSPDDRAAAEFVYIPFFGAAPPEEEGAEASLSLAINVVSAGVRAGTSNASLRVERRPPNSTADVVLRSTGDADFHHRLRQREIAELTPLIRRSRAARTPGTAPRESLAAARQESRTVPEVGDLRTYNVAISCSEEKLRTGRVMHVSEHAVVVADTGNPAGLTSSDYEYFGITFDTLVYPVETAHFGVPHDIDDNGRAILFFTRAVNELSSAGGQSVTIGFFWSGDLFPEEAAGRLEACPAANQAEIFYLIAPDPAGVVGPRFPLAELRRRAIPLIGHEFQHLVNASRRLFVNDADGFEEPWLNEGLSHAAEELLFYAATGLQPRRNLTADDLRATPSGVEAFNEYVAANLSNFRRYLSDPSAASLLGNDDFATRGAAWSFLRYAADRSGRGDELFFFDVVNSRTEGVDNLAAVIGPEAPLDWMRDWTVSVYADDFVPGIAERFRMASWNLRDIYQATATASYPLQVRSLGPDAPVRADLSPGGALYTQFGTAADEQGIVHVDADGAALPAALRGSFLRVR